MPSWVCYSLRMHEWISNTTQRQLHHMQACRMATSNMLGTLESTMWLTTLLFLSLVVSPLIRRKISQRRITHPKANSVRRHMIVVSHVLIVRDSVAGS
jgi:hypothetical protein